ncbi:MAG: hypothetical protein KDA84_24930 [Planctomycetaceae bacterium]|nr:hypothetical protein [Planctomycetaceae bacterium]
MANLNLPEGTEAGFRFDYSDAFGDRFVINVYGRHRKGWFVATVTDPNRSLTTPPTPLKKGEWRTLLNFIKQCRFWELPEEFPEPALFALFDVDDGHWFTLSGRDGSTFHQIHRFVWCEPGLVQLENYFRKISRLFDEFETRMSGEEGETEPVK